MSVLKRNAFGVALTVLAGLPWAASAQEENCLKSLYQCRVCFQNTGGIDISGCREEPPAEAEGIPAELLEGPSTDGLDGVQKLVGDRILSHWNVLSSVFGDKNRIYLPRETYDLAGRYPGATADEVLRAAVIRFQRFLVARANRARVVRVPTGDGGHTVAVQASDVLMAFVVRLLDDAGAFADVDLEDFIVPGELGLAPGVVLPEDPLFELFERSLEIRE